MIKYAKMSAVLAVMAVLTSTGGCVMKSTYDAVVADNARLKTGLGVLADGVGVTAGKVETMGTSAAKLQAEGSDMAAKLSEIQAMVTSHVAALTELTATIGPFKKEIEALRAKSAALAGQPVPAKVAPAVPKGAAVSASSQH